MKRPSRVLRASFAGWLGLLALTLPVAAQVVLPLEFHAVHLGETWINLQSQAGVPISMTTNDPPGSNGQQPEGNESTGVFTPPTGGQFRNFLTFGAIPGLKQSDWLVVRTSAILQAGATPFSGVVAAEMRRPRATVGGQVVMVLRRAQVGAPFLSRQVSFAFGAIVSVPEKDETGALLSGIPSTAYWLPEPFTTNDHAGAGYYWSPHARQVYAIQPGPLAITWVKAQPYTAATKPAGYENPGGGPSFWTNGPNIFLLFTERYLVSGTAAKPPRKIYWTEKSFQKSGLPVRVPQARVGAVNVVYNNNFPRTVTEEFQAVGASSPTDGTTNQPLPELRTLWFDQVGQEGSLRAYNYEGRVFVELLGDLRPDGKTYIPLGYEIVDVTKQPVPLDMTIELGERILPPEGGSVDELYPEPLQQSVLGGFAYRRDLGAGLAPELYAIKETFNVNDYLVHWLETGEAGLRWPRLFGRYALRWPTDVSRYSHYVRPPARDKNEAALTGVQLEPQNAPVIEYQDTFASPRADLTADYKFYTWLDDTVPVHRTLLRFSAGDQVAFERVFSWLDANLRTGDFTGPSLSPAARAVVAGLSAWNAQENRFDWPGSLALTAPRVVSQTVNVGERILPPPESDVADGEGYVAGHINRAIGTSYNVNAYADPLRVGFEAANRGAIIPVNAIPGKNRLEVWWFRLNGPHAGFNSGNTLLGFRSIYWPTVVGRYTLRWPEQAREIVLASLQGGTGLTSYEAQGSIYYQNDPNADGYNPNEEHAIMSGGQPFATRDDLNILDPPERYSSHPYVLVEYQHPDGRPAMTVFKVLREKPEAGWVFDYLVPAGQKLQPPPPLTFLAKPVEGSGDAAVNYNTEPTGGDGDLPGSWTPEHASGPYGHYQRFTYRDRKHDFWVYRGLHAGLPALAAGTYNPTTRQIDPPAAATAVAGQLFSYAVHVSRQAENLVLNLLEGPDWLSTSGLTLAGTPQTEDVGASTVTFTVRDLYDQTTVTQQFALTVAASALPVTQPPLAIVSTNPYTGSVVTFTDRPPFLAESPTPTNSFTMRFYYKTEPGFAWPGVANPPPPGSIVPYLRPRDPVSGQFVGDPASKDTPSLQIVYRPYWPVRDPKDSSKPIPTLPFGATLTEPAFNLPGVRDFKTARILYQQSIAANLSNALVSAVLHDPTRAKFVEITNQFADRLPASIRTEYYQGKYYFPNLPPHLVNRLYLDPNRGSKGSLVLVGQYQKELLGESYLLLNVLRGSDLQAAHDLCPAADTENRPRWVALVNALATRVETFHEDLPLRPGAYVPDPARTRTVGVGNLAEVDDDNIAVDSYALSATGPGEGYITLVEAGGTAFTEPGDPVSLHIFKVGGSLHRGEIKILPAPNPLSELITFQHTADLAGRFDEYEYEWKIAAPVDGFPPEPDATMSRYLPLTNVVADLPRYTLGGAGIQVLGDNYVVMRYRPRSQEHPLRNQWSEWTRPALAEGWIKRVLAGINPFNQRVTDLFNNRVNTDVSLLTQAGRRWEGDVALNLDTINNYGLIEIYETVLRRGRLLSIEAGFNYGPANDALLLAAGYLNDLYMLLGHEAWADAANPTIGIGTADRTYGEIATALFAFRGQVASLLEEELALLRGRDDFFLPGVEIAPVYNRLVWNYTRGIDAGEVIYALNYNIQENPDQSPDGIINAEDAARMFPQGHGDAYGHYLTALKGYYSLLMNRNFDWVPRIEAVNVLGQPVSVDYQDERKFAAAAAAVARAGRQIFDLTWRQDYRAVSKQGWEHFAATRVNTRRSYINATDGSESHPVRYWGLDHWASRVGQGAYLHWVVGNAILPAVDPDPTHEGIQKVDRTTVPELRELATLAGGLQTALDNAERGLSPLGIPEDGLALDINPNAVVGVEGGTHFEQIYQRARAALNNALAAFDDAKDVTRLMRSEQDSLAEFQNAIARQEQAYKVALIELYGTPYPDDMGPGKSYPQDYDGPDLIHYTYVDLPEKDIPEVWSYSNTTEWAITLRDLPADWTERFYTSHTYDHDNNPSTPEVSIFRDVEEITFNIGPHGYAEKPAHWTSRRRHPGKIQQALSALILAHMRLRHTINDTAGDLVVFQKALDVFDADVRDRQTIRDMQLGLLLAEEVLEKVKLADELWQAVTDSVKEDIEESANVVAEGIPRSFIVGLASGGDLTSAGRAFVKQAGFVITKSFDVLQFARKAVVMALETATSSTKRWTEFAGIGGLEREIQLRNAIHDLGNKLGDMQERLWTINEHLREYDDRQREVRALIAQGENIQAEREIFRQRAAAVIQGYRTRDAAFRIFRNEKLERYKTLFDLAARYALLAANAYDYETGLLGASQGRDFVRRIINARALGVVRQGEPQFAGSNTGDPGLSSALAEMKADWDVLRGRLGFNNPDAYGTTVSLRAEKLRLLPGPEGDSAWQDFLQQCRRRDLLADADVRRYCLQIDDGSGLPVPGLVIEFATTIADGVNLFGLPLAAGDHAFSPSAFATKIHALGVALEGYRGMDNPAANQDAVSGAGGVSPSDPIAWFLDPLALAATPYVYFIPTGVDAMRSPPLGDRSEVRTWNVQDLAIPMPFNIGASPFSEGVHFLSADSLTEPLFALRKHQAFRPVSSPAYFSPNLYSSSGTLLRSQFTNNRLIGRSVWNSQWKLVIPGRTLLNNPDEGLERFIRTVRDIKLHFVTYSYSGN